MLHKTGVPFLAGTDTPAGVHIFPGYSLHEDCSVSWLRDSLLSKRCKPRPSIPRAFSKWKTRWEPVEKGKLADLVLLSAHPLEDIANTQKIASVIVNGRYFYRAELDRMLGRVENAARRQR